MALGNKYQHLKKNHKHRDRIYMPLKSLAKVIKSVWFSLWSQLPICRRYWGHKNIQNCMMSIYISKIQTVVNSTCQMAQVVKQINCKESRKGWMGDFRFSYVQSLSRVRLFATPWTAACQASLSITNSRSLLKLISIELVMPPNYLILCRPLLLLPSFSASGSFQMSQLFTSGGQSIGVSASTSVLPVNIQDWFPLWWTGWISLQFKGLSRVFSNTTVQKHQFLGTQLSL